MAQYTGVVGVVELNEKLDNIANIDLKKVLLECAEMVREDAYHKAPSGSTHQLKDSLGDASRAIQMVDDKTIAIGTNVEYAPYVEIGTGIYAGDSPYYGQYADTGRQTWWVWVENGDPAYEGTGKKEPYYTYEEAKRAMAILCSKGLKAHISQGFKPKPFLLPALQENEPKIQEKFKEEIHKEAE